MSCSETFRFRQVYLKRLVETLEGLKNSSSSNDDEVTGSNDHNIKLAVDVSLALTAKQAAWSRALLSRISNDEKNRAALRKILEPKKFQEILAQRLRYRAHLVLLSKLKRAHVHKQQRKISVGIISRILSTKRLEPVTSVHSSLVNERKRKLQRLVPGGKTMDTSCLLQETAHYITSLTTQIEVLQYLIHSANNTQHPVCNNFPS